MRATYASKEYIHSCSIRVIPATESFYYNSWKAGTPGYASVTVEQIVGNSEDLELDFIGGDAEKTLGDALNGIVLWRKADIILIANTTAPVDPNDRPSLHPPSPPSSHPAASPPSPPRQRATSTPTPPAPEKGKKRTSSFPAAGTQTKKQKKVEKDTAPRKKLTYKKTAEELEEETARYVKE